MPCYAVCPFSDASLDESCGARRTEPSWSEVFQVLFEAQKAQVQCNENLG